MSTGEEDSDSEIDYDSPCVEESYHSFAMKDDDMELDHFRVSDQQFYFSLITEDDRPVSHAEYAQELFLQEILNESLFNSSPPLSSPPSPPPPSLPPVSCIASSSEANLATKGEEEEVADVLIICEICVEAKEPRQMFKNLLCDHSFCYECVTKQVATKIQENVTIVPCPGLNCKGVLDIDACRILLPKDILDRWNDALCDAHFLGVPKIYCPFKDCCAMMVLDIGMEDIRESECPSCHRLFCAMCYVPWHPGVKCEEYQKMNEDEKGREDLLVKELANEKEWSRCPQCKFYVEKIEGCLHVTCRCNFQFCYRCGKPWTPNHGRCRRN